MAGSAACDQPVIKQARCSLGLDPSFVRAASAPACTGSAPGFRTGMKRLPDDQCIRSRALRAPGSGTGYRFPSRS